MYTEEKKNIARETVIKNAICKLTVERNNSIILNDDLVRFYYEQCNNMLIKSNKYESLEQSNLNNWLQYNRQYIGTKNAGELKVLYLAGPNPENDLNVLINNGISIENVWALEVDSNTFNNAVDSISFADNDKLKLYKCKLETFLNMFPIKFDIIYADYTASLFSKDKKPYKSVHSIFENHSLADISALIINTTVADNTDNNIELFADYYLNQEWVDGHIFDEKYDHFIEGPETNGISIVSELKKIFKRNFADVYSAIQTHYLLYMPAILLPGIRNVSNPDIRKYIFNENNLKETFHIFENFDEFNNNEFNDFLSGEYWMNADWYPFLHFLDRIKESKIPMIKSLADFYCNDRINGISRYEAIRLTSILRASLEGFSEIALNEKFWNNVMETANYIFDRQNLFFCDVPMENLWVDVIYNQMGHPYHARTSAIERYKYAAKTREMYTDLIIYDKCRNLYDFLPSLDLLPLFVRNFSDQILMRILIDIIEKNSMHIIHELYYGASVLSILDVTKHIDSYYGTRKKL